jgi:hypothetical protein
MYKFIRISVDGNIDIQIYVQYIMYKYVYAEHILVMHAYPADLQLVCTYKCLAWLPYSF